jgi:hypothetical protein
MVWWARFALPTLDGIFAAVVPNPYHPLTITLS